MLAWLKQHLTILGQYLSNSYRLVFLRQTLLKQSIVLKFTIHWVVLKFWAQTRKLQDKEDWKIAYCKSGFNLTNRDSYFSILVEVFTNRILAENTNFTNHAEWTEHKITAWKSVNKCQVIWQSHSFKSTLINYFQHHLFIYQAKVL